MKTLVVGTLLALSITTSARQGGSPAAVQIWKASDIQAKGQALSKKLDAGKVASETIATVGNRSFMIAHREGSGQSEVHDKQADIMVIASGQLTMVTGGKIVDGRTTAPGETRGTGISGGNEVTLGPGDVLHIPAGVPHQMKLAPGAQVTYFVAKVVE
jgi:mannose-6-phosphate isomerase-like protein (cupin superfamily)